MSPDFVHAIQLIAQIGEGTQYAFRGTTSLVLQGLDMGLQDIDLTGNSSAAHSFHAKFIELSKYSVKDIWKSRFVSQTEKRFPYGMDRSIQIVSPLVYSEQGIHKSWFGQYKIDKVRVEMMGEWQIKTGDSWSEIIDARPSQITHVAFQGLTLPVTTIETELKCYLLLRRFAVYHKIRRQLNLTSPK